MIQQTEKLVDFENIWFDLRFGKINLFVYQKQNQYDFLLLKIQVKCRLKFVLN